jgi:hypothetical protein
MAAKAKTKIVVETYQRQVIRFGKKPSIVFCGFCRKETEMVQLNQAALRSKTTVLQVFRLIEKGEIHFCQSETGDLLICLNSLLNFEIEK